MRRRQGFTIIELLVSMALIIFIMLILTEAFSAGLETFRQLKAVGDMQERLRSATIVMRRDLQALHFDQGSGRLSDQQLNRSSNGDYEPPLTGYFRIIQIPPSDVPGTNPPRRFPQPNGAPVLASGDAYILNGHNNSTFEGDEPAGVVVLPPTPPGTPISVLPSVRSTTHAMQFTCMRQPHLVGRDNFRTVNVPASPTKTPPPDDYPNNATALELQGPAAYQARGIMNTQWYEVSYFLRPVVDAGGNPLTTTGISPTPRFALHRRERAISDEKDPGFTTLPAADPTQQWEDISYTRDVSGAKLVNRPDDVQDPRCRFMSDQMVTPTAMNPYPKQYAGVPSAAFPAFNWGIIDTIAGSGANQAKIGDDLLVTDVISFDIKVLQQGWNPLTQTISPGNDLFPQYVDLPPAAVTKMGTKTPVPYDLNASGSIQGYNSEFYDRNWSVFDTWSHRGSRMFNSVSRPPSKSVGYPYLRDESKSEEGWWPELAGASTTAQPYHLPMPIRVFALRITIRIWDQKTEQAREVTVIQNM